MLGEREIDAHRLDFVEGHSLVHGVGHWLGLLHPSHSGCIGGSAYGDYIPDTPRQEFMNEQCTNGPDEVSTDDFVLKTK